MLVGHAGAGAAIAAGMALCSPISALAGLGGSLVGLLTAAAFGADPRDAHEGVCVRRAARALRGARALSASAAAVLMTTRGVERRTGVTVSRERAGLWGYNAVLGAIATCGMFYVLSPRVVALSVLNAVFCAALGGAMKLQFAAMGAPARTFID